MAPFGCVGAALVAALFFAVTTAGAHKGRPYEVGRRRGIPTKRTGRAQGIGISWTFLGT
jgi:hypothetical protein